MSKTMPMLNLYWDTSCTSANNSSLVEEILDKFEDYCNKTNVSPNLTIYHSGSTDTTPLWNLVDGASKHSIKSNLEVHNTDFCIIRPITHLISQINITDNLDAFFVQKMDVNSYVATIDGKINSLREMNPNICIELITEVNSKNFSIIWELGKKNDDFIFDRWRIFRSSKDPHKISDFQFFSFIRNNYGYTNLVSKSNIFIRNETLAPSLKIYDHKVNSESLGVKLLFQNNISERHLAYRDYSECIHDTSSRISTFEDCLHDIKFDVTKIDNRDEKRITSHVIREMEKFFHLR